MSWDPPEGFPNAKPQSTNDPTKPKKAQKSPLTSKVVKKERKKKIKPKPRPPPNKSDSEDE